MSESQDEVRNGFSLGVLIIGSLHWDPDCRRKKWRADRLLNLHSERFVRAPIRYGRRSRKRGCSYTMVFSSGLGADQYGRAIVVPCKHRVYGKDNLIREAECLWAVEAKTKPGDPRRLSADWGCVALLVNPNLTKSDQLCTLLDGWNERVSRERCYGQLNSAVCEDVVVDESGHMKIPWLESEDRSDLGVDILLATATNPTIVGGHYPSAQQVAAAWDSRDGRNYVDYFCKNRACGIKTFQDDSIQENLRALWQQKGVPQS